MKKLTTLCVLLLAAFCLTGSDEGTPKKGSPEFERMKTLAGSWKGKVDIGNGPTDITVQYRLIAAGSVLEERCFVGTPNEMVMMYYDGPDGKLAMTHYCMLGNRPGMRLKSSDEKTIQFDFDKTCGINPEKEMHMHALTIRFDDADTITSSCLAMADGKPLPEDAVTLKRIKQ